MTIQIRKAERRKAKLRLGIAAPSGAGKTWGALELAFSLGGKIGLVDTEHGSGDLYAHRGEYDIVGVTAPYTVAKYLEAIKAFEDAGYNTIILDSISHAWAGEGGLLDKQGKIADSSRSGNSYTAWRQITPEHNALVEAMLKSPCHIIATMRSKQEYVQEKNAEGKTVIKKVGMAPVQRDGMEYEFTVMLDISTDHIATSTKDRTGLLDGQYFKIDRAVGKRLLDWLDAGSAAPPADAPVNTVTGEVHFPNDVALDGMGGKHPPAMQVRGEVVTDAAMTADDEPKREYLDAIAKAADMDALKTFYQGALKLSKDKAWKEQVVMAKDARKAQLTASTKEFLDGYGTEQDVPQ